MAADWASGHLQHGCCFSSGCFGSGHEVGFDNVRSRLCQWALLMLFPLVSPHSSPLPELCSDPTFCGRIWRGRCEWPLAHCVNGSSRLNKVLHNPSPFFKTKWRFGILAFGNLICNSTPVENKRQITRYFEIKFMWLVTLLTCWPSRWPYHASVSWIPFLESRSEFTWKLEWAQTTEIAELSGIFFPANRISHCLSRYCNKIRPTLHMYIISNLSLESQGSLNV